MCRFQFCLQRAHCKPSCRLDNNAKLGNVDQKGRKLHDARFSILGFGSDADAAELRARQTADRCSKWSRNGERQAVSDMIACSSGCGARCLLIDRTRVDVCSVCACACTWKFARDCDLYMSAAASICCNARFVSSNSKHSSPQFLTAVRNKLAIAPCEVSHRSAQTSGRIRACPTLRAPFAARWPQLKLSDRDCWRTPLRLPVSKERLQIDANLAHHASCPATALC